MEKINKIIQNGLEYEVQDKPLTDEVELLKTKTKNIETSIEGVYKKPADGIGRTDLSEAVKQSLSKADTAIQDISGKLDKTEAANTYQLKGEYLKNEDLTDYATHQYVDSKKLSEFENDSKFVREEELESEIYYIHINRQGMENCETAHMNGTTDLSTFNILGENEDESIITKDLIEKNLYFILVDEAGQKYPLTSKSGSSFEFIAPDSSKKLTKISFNITNSTIDRTTINVASNKLVVEKDLSKTLGDYAKTADIDVKLGNKQDLLVSGTNIKTINGNPLIGEGNITITTEGTSGAPIDDNNIATTSTYSSQKIDDTFLKNPNNNYLALNYGISASSSTAEAYFGNGSILFNNKETNGSVSITPKYNSEDSTILVNNLELARKKDLDNYALKTEIPTQLPASDVYDWAKAETKPSYTASEVSAYSKTEIDEKGFLTNQSLNGYAKTVDVPTKLSDLTNDSGYITTTALDGYVKNDAIANFVSQSTFNTELDKKLDKTSASQYLTNDSLTGYATESWVKTQNYLTTHQSLDEYAKIIDVDEKVNKKLDITTANTTYALKTDIPTNLLNGTGISAVQQKQDGTDGAFDFTDKNLNATAIDSTLTGAIEYGAIGNYSVSIGGKSSAKGKRSRAAGSTTIAIGNYSSVEGSDSVAFGNASHVEGYMNTSGPDADSAHAEGGENIVSAARGHVEGYKNIVNAMNGHAEGENCNVTENAEAGHAEGTKTKSANLAAHAEGQETEALGINSHAQNTLNIAKGDSSHAEGYGNTVNSYAGHIEGAGNKILNQLPTSGEDTPGITPVNPSDPNFNIDEHLGYNSHVEGSLNLSYGYTSHTEGANNKTFGHYDHTEGTNNINKGECNHIEGDSNTLTVGKYGHVEGYKNKVSSGNGYAYHVSGISNNVGAAIGSFVHGKENDIDPNAAFSILLGEHLKVTDGSVIIAGTYNAPIDGVEKMAAFGCGKSEDTRQNAIEIMRDGRVKVLKEPKEDTDVARKKELNTKLDKTEAANTYQPIGEYLIEHQSLEGYAKTNDINNKLNNYFSIPTNQTTATAGQLLSKTTDGSEWKTINFGDVSSSGNNTFTGDNNFKKSIQVSNNEDSTIFTDYSAGSITTHIQNKSYTFTFPIEKETNELATNDIINVNPEVSDSTLFLNSITIKGTNYKVGNVNSSNDNTFMGHTTLTNTELAGSNIFSGPSSIFTHSIDVYNNSNPDEKDIKTKYSNGAIQFSPSGRTDWITFALPMDDSKTGSLVLATTDDILNVFNYTDIIATANNVSAVETNIIFQQNVNINIYKYIVVKLVTGSTNNIQYSGFIPVTEIINNRGNQIYSVGNYFTSLTFRFELDSDVFKIKSFHSENNEVVDVYIYGVK